MIKLLRISPEYNHYTLEYSHSINGENKIEIIRANELRTCLVKYESVLHLWLCKRIEYVIGRCNSLSKVFATENYYNQDRKQYLVRAHNMLNWCLNNSKINSLFDISSKLLSDETQKIFSNIIPPHSHPEHVDLMNKVNEIKTLLKEYDV